MSAKQKEDLQPFEESVNNQMLLYGVDFHTAMETVQARYESFKARNDALLERQNTLSNNAQIQLISHFSLLATLTLTVVGFIVTQTSQPLTLLQKITVVAILTFEAISLVFGAIDYLQSIAFHRSWALRYQAVDKEMSEKINSGKVQWLSDLDAISRKHKSKQAITTRVWITYCMIGFCTAGLILLIALFIGYFFDLPLV